MEPTGDEDPLSPDRQAPYAPVRFLSARLDPEFASPTTIELEARDLRPTGISPEFHLRIVANPFLGFAGLIFWLVGVLWAAKQVLSKPHQLVPMTPLIVPLILASLWLVPLLFHYHCLDCGGSGRLSRWRRHTCPTSAIRRITGRTRRLRGPSPPAQIILWLWVVLCVAIVLSWFGADYQALMR